MKPTLHRELLKLLTDFKTKGTTWSLQCIKHFETHPANAASRRMWELSIKLCRKSYSKGSNNCLWCTAACLTVLRPCIACVQSFASSCWTAACTYDIDIDYAVVLFSASQQVSFVCELISYLQLLTGCVQVQWLQLAACKIVYLYHNRLWPVWQLAF